MQSTLDAFVSTAEWEVGETMEDGYGYYWCPFCGKRWKEKLPWADISENGPRVCIECYEHGRTYGEWYTEGFWEKYLQKEPVE